MLDYRLDTFLALCETLSYHKAAEKLHISQPAVTQHIQFLEREYGCKLFTYQNRSLQKTSSGELLEQYARSMRNYDTDFRRQLRNNRVNDLRVGATKTIGDYVINDQVRDYLEAENNSLTLIVDNTERLLHLLDENRLDFAIVEGYFDKNHYNSKCLRREPFVGICKKGHRFSGKEIALSQLLEETIIHREKGSGTRAILEQKLLGYNESFIHFRRNICISSFKLILESVKNGLGVSFVYKVLADSDPELDHFSFQGEEIVREFNVVWLRNTEVQEKIRAFLGNSFCDVGEPCTSG